MKTFINGTQNAEPQVGKWNYLERTGVVTLHSSGHRTNKAGRQGRRYHARRVTCGLAFHSNDNVQPSQFSIKRDGVTIRDLGPAVVTVGDVYFAYQDVSRL